jgi:hypothetical protein
MMSLYTAEKATNQVNSTSYLLDAARAKSLFLNVDTARC